MLKAVNLVPVGSRKHPSFPGQDAANWIPHPGDYGQFVPSNSPLPIYIHKLGW